MKKKVALILAVLALSAAGCAAEQNTDLTEKPNTDTTVIAEVLPSTEETTAEVTTVETTMAETEETTVETQPRYPQILETEINREGNSEQLVMELYQGDGYVIYIPLDEWTVETEQVGEYTAQKWANVYNDVVTLQVINCGGLTLDEAEVWISAEKSNYVLDKSEDGDISGYDFENRYMLHMRLHSDGVNTFVVLNECPMELGDGFAPQLHAMADSFEIA